MEFPSNTNSLQAVWLTPLWTAWFSAFCLTVRVGHKLCKCSTVADLSFFNSLSFSHFAKHEDNLAEGTKWGSRQTSIVTSKCTVVTLGNWLTIHSLSFPPGNETIISRASASSCSTFVWVRNSILLACGTEAWQAERELDLSLCWLPQLARPVRSFQAALKGPSSPGWHGPRWACMGRTWLAFVPERKITLCYLHCNLLSLLLYHQSRWSQVFYASL